MRSGLHTSMGLNGPRQIKSGPRKIVIAQNGPFVINSAHGQQRYPRGQYKEICNEREKCRR